MFSGFAQIIQRFISADSRAFIWLKRLFVIYLCVAGLINISFSAQALLKPYVYKKDFIQEYLLAKATLSGVNPYLPLPDLAQQFIGRLPNPIFPHPTPHPPPVALIAWPLGFMDYQAAAIVWFVFEIICIALSLSILLKWSRVKRRFCILMIGLLAIFVWNPFWEELVFGQLMTILLLLLLLSWQSFCVGCPIRGGVLLGIVISLKLVVWPILLFLALINNWRAVFASITAILMINVASMLLLGYETILLYYCSVGGMISKLYRGFVSNFSLWTVGFRLFEGTGSPVIAGATAPPIFMSAVLAHCVAVVLPLILLIVGLILALRSHDFDISFAIMICVSILVNPIAWVHYLILALFPLWVIAQTLLRYHFPRTETHVTIICGLLLLISHRRLHDFAVSLSATSAIGDSVSVNPWILVIFTMLPAILVLTLIWLLYRMALISKKRTAVFLT